MFHLEKLKDMTRAHESVVTVSNRFEVVDALEGPVELWDTFKRETLEGHCRASVGNITHFWRVVQHLEFFQTPYKWAETLLVGNHARFTHPLHRVSSNVFIFFFFLVRRSIVVVPTYVYGSAPYLTPRSHTSNLTPICL